MAKGISGVGGMPMGAPTMSRPKKPAVKGVPKVNTALPVAGAQPPEVPGFKRGGMVGKAASKAPAKAADKGKASKGKDSGKKGKC